MSLPGSEPPLHPTRAGIPALLRTAAADAQAAQAFARLARIAAGMLRAPVSVLSVVDVEAPALLRVRGAFGVPDGAGAVRVMRKDEAPCHDVLAGGDAHAVEDVRAQPRYAGMPLLAQLRAAAYLGVPLAARGGHALGTLCVIDHAPRPWSAHERMLLAELADVAVRELERLDELARRQRAEDALRARERLFRAVFDRASQLMAVCSPDGVLLDANQAALDSVGLDADAVEGRPFAEAPWWSWCSAQRAAVASALARAGAGLPARCSLAYLAADGQRRPLDFTATPVRDGVGTVSFVLVEGREVSAARPAPVRCADPACAYADVLVDASAVRR